MASTYKGPGYRRNHTNETSAAIAAGDVVVLSTRISVAIADIAVGALGAVGMGGVYELAAKSADSWSAGATIYWDATLLHLTDTVGANPVAGIAFEAKLALATVAKVMVNGIPEQ